jgi:hypothetical protein
MSLLMQYNLSAITGDHTTGLSDAREFFLPAGYLQPENFIVHPFHFPAGLAEPLNYPG